MAYWGRSPRTSLRPQNPFIIGGGLNLAFSPFEIPRSDSTDCSNISSEEFPSLSVVQGRASRFSSLPTINGLGQRNNEFPHVLSGTTWYRWSGSAWVSVQTGVSNNRCEFIEFNREADKNTILVNNGDVLVYDGTSVIVVTDAPKTMLYTVDDYRLYALIGNELKCSAVSTYDDWTTAFDAESITLVNAKGPGTAIVAYKDIIIAWTEQTMHVLYGNDPYDFELVNPLDDGCISHRSVIEHRGILYFMDYGAIKQYTGGRPQEISQKIRKYLEGINQTYKHLIASGTYGKYIYWSIPYGPSATTNNVTIQLDTEHGQWYILGTGYVDFTNIKEALYGVDATGAFYELHSGTSNAGSPIVWSKTTGAWNYNTLSQQKSIGELWLNIDLPTGSTLTIEFSTDSTGNVFTTLATFSGDSINKVGRIKVPTDKLTGIDWFRLRFSGTGPCKIHSIEESLRIKGR